ncbi:hypothetical protein BU14_0192s0026 [Porphyra umbilicalis]|uniref:Uncharacterized protein n=1 Tax=Porphyra umbilicalis TaxID=2786 RepID=A0A1X6P670_PORUM|nr:hypothetical protein BU14_0192s0026 [Porphyra umbilicalis]|eukprot:OSX76409.1 hypothetical protein BU14_0192s0026 [Porphyra umbilicalis]
MGNCFGRPPGSSTIHPTSPPATHPTFHSSSSRQQPSGPTRPQPSRTQPTRPHESRPHPSRAKRRPPSRPIPPAADAARLGRARQSAAATGVLSLNKLSLTAVPPSLASPPPLTVVRTVSVAHNALLRLDGLPAATPAAVRVDAPHNRLVDLGSVGGWSRLRRLDVSHNALGGRALVALLLSGGGWGLTALAEVDASFNPAGPALAAAPAAAAAAAGAPRPPPALRVLRLDGCGLTAIGGGVLGGLAGSLAELSLSANRLAALPADVTRCGRLTALAADGNRLGGLPPDFFGALGALTALTVRGNPGLRMAAVAAMDGYGAYEARRVGGSIRRLGGGLWGGGRV